MTLGLVYAEYVADQLADQLKEPEYGRGSGRLAACAAPPRSVAPSLLRGERAVGENPC
jgi:hypothetical protein